MPVTVACPSCNVKLNIPDSFLGKKVRCATCSTVFEARAVGAPPAEPASEAIRPSQEPLPEAPLEEVPAGEPRRRRDRDDRDDFDHDDHDDRDSRRSRRRRRDLEPHRGGLLMGLGIASIALGALGLTGVCCCFLDILPIAGLPCGLCAWLMGQGDLKRIDQGTLDPDGRGSTQGGYICGIIGTALCGLDLLCSAAWFILSLAMNLGSMGMRGY